MIQRYNKENKHSLINGNTNIKFLAYCNYSFIKEKHLKEENALSLFDKFDKEKSPFYIRIFNEMPRTVLEDFITKNNIDKNKVINIYKDLKLNTSFRLEDYN